VAQENLIELTAAVVSAYVGTNKIASGDLPGLINQIHSALHRSATGTIEPEQPLLVPAVPIKKSVTPDYIISLEDGRKFKSMKRHIGNLGMTPDEYRVKWGLPRDYPMVAAGYAKKRSELAKSMGLGRKAATGSSAKRARTRKRVAGR
jgi:predicted transcriptional regulator